MKVVLAFDSFKGSLSAADACRIAADALSELRSDIELVLIPLADGGEGTAAALMAYRPGEWISAPATGPLASLCVDAGFAWFKFDKTAMVDTASASGIRTNSMSELSSDNASAAITHASAELRLPLPESQARTIFMAVD